MKNEGRLIECRTRMEWMKSEWVMKTEWSGIRQALNEWANNSEKNWMSDWLMLERKNGGCHN